MTQTVTGEKTLVMVKVGDPKFFYGRHAWVPTADQLKLLQETLENAFGDRYDFLVYHYGMDVTVVKGDYAVEVVEVKSLDELREEAERNG